MKTNLEEIGKENPEFETDRRQYKQSESVVCSGCNRYLLKSSLAKHRTTCIGEGPKTYAIEIPLLKRSDVELTDDFKAHIISTMRNDSIGLKCKNDQSILLFGFRLYDKVKRRDDNIAGSRKDVQTKMRGLAHLHHIFVTETKPIKQAYNDTKDLFVIKNFEMLKNAITLYTRDPEGEDFKSGLQVNLQYLLIKAAKIFKAHALTEDKDEEIKMFDQFLTALNVWKVAIILFFLFTEFDKSNSAQTRYQILVFYDVCVVQCDWLTVFFKSSLLSQPNFLFCKGIC